ncbi:hypothetical protein [Microbacterium sp. BH-3-3-3]|uniref:hypothetical protein n=1 Tax=Microbacterium sp. BH-3-3-3 TaxID=1906742 RepID=UPI0037CB4A47
MDREVLTLLSSWSGDAHNAYANAQNQWRARMQRLTTSSLRPGSRPHPREDPAQGRKKL